MQRATAVGLQLLLLTGSLAYRFVDLDGGVPATTPHFMPYTQGGAAEATADVNTPSGIQPNQGNPFSAAQPSLFRGVLPRMNCPGMIGPFNGTNSGLFQYYCTSEQAGYCDRRSGTCFCNYGYVGADCSGCHPSFRMAVDGTCVPRTDCPNGCSGGGTCDDSSGLCSCYPGRRGVDCSLELCRILDRWCISCDDFQNCMACEQGYYLEKTATNSTTNGSVLISSRCIPCTVYDPNCYECNEDRCLGCADQLLNSALRSGRRRVDPVNPVQESFFRRKPKLSPFGTQDGHDAFLSADAYILVDDYATQQAMGVQSGSWNPAEACLWAASPLLASTPLNESAIRVFLQDAYWNIRIVDYESLETGWVRQYLVNCAVPEWVDLYFGLGPLGGDTPKALGPSLLMQTTIQATQTMQLTCSSMLNYTECLAEAVLDPLFQKILTAVWMEVTGANSSALLQQSGLQRAYSGSVLELPASGAVVGSIVTPPSVYPPGLLQNAPYQRSDGRAGTPLNTADYADLYDFSLNSSIQQKFAPGSNNVPIAQKYKNAGGTLPQPPISSFAALSPIDPEAATNLLVATIDAIVSNCSLMTLPLPDYCSQAGEIQSASLDVFSNATKAVFVFNIDQSYAFAGVKISDSPLSASSDVAIFVRAAAKPNDAQLLNASAFSCDQSLSVLPPLLDTSTWFVPSDNQWSIVLDRQLEKGGLPIHAFYETLSTGNSANGTVNANVSAIPADSQLCTTRSGWHSLAPHLDSASLISAPAITCKRTQIPNSYCGNSGEFSFEAETYVVYESAGYLRVAVVRSGGGLGRATVSYALEHIETDDADVTATSPFIPSTTLVFDEGVVRQTFLVTIHDDTIPEGSALPPVPHYYSVSNTSGITQNCALPSCSISALFVDNATGCDFAMSYTPPLLYVNGQLVNVNSARTSVSGNWRDHLGPHETFRLILRNPCCGNTLGDNALTTVAILDDDADVVSCNYTTAFGSLTLPPPADIYPMGVLLNWGNTGFVVPPVTPETRLEPNPFAAQAFIDVLLNVTAPPVFSVSHELGALVATMPYSMAGSPSTLRLSPRDWRMATINDTRVSLMFTNGGGAPGNGSVLSTLLGAEEFVLRMEVLDPAVMGSAGTYQTYSTQQDILAVPSRSNSDDTANSSDTQHGYFFSLGEIPDFTSPSSVARGKPGTDELQVARFTFDNNTGTYVTTVQVNSAGRHRIIVYHSVPGGLIGEYYDNPHLAGEPVLKRKDHHITFRWGFGSLFSKTCNDTAPGQPRCGHGGVADQVSVRWRGAIKLDDTSPNGTYTFYIIADNGIRFWLNGKLLLDEWDTTSSYEPQVTGSRLASQFTTPEPVDVLHTNARTPFAQNAPGLTGLNPSTVTLNPQRYGRTGAGSVLACSYGNFGPSSPPTTKLFAAVGSYESGLDARDYYASPHITCVESDLLLNTSGVANSYFLSPFDTKITGASEPRLYNDAYRTFRRITTLAALQNSSGATDDRMSAAIMVPVRLQAGQYYDLVSEYRDLSGYSTFELLWTTPGVVEPAPIPPSNLFVLEEVSLVQDEGDLQDLENIARGPRVSYVHPAPNFVVGPSSLTSNCFNGLCYNSSVSSFAVLHDPALLPSPYDNPCAAAGEGCTFLRRWLQKGTSLTCESGAAPNNFPSNSLLPGLTSGSGSLAFSCLFAHGIVGQLHPIYILPRDAYGNERGLLSAYDNFHVSTTSLILLPELDVQSVLNSASCQVAITGETFGIGTMPAFAVSLKRRSSPLPSQLFRHQVNVSRIVYDADSQYQLASGTHLAAVTPQISGVYATSVTTPLLSLPTRLPVHVYGSPFVSLVESPFSSEYSPANSLVFGSGIAIDAMGIIAGQPYTVIVSPRDRKGNTMSFNVPSSGLVAQPCGIIPIPGDISAAVRIGVKAENMDVRPNFVVGETQAFGLPLGQNCTSSPTHIMGVPFTFSNLGWAEAELTDVPPYIQGRVMGQLTNLYTPFAISVYNPTITGRYLVNVLSADGRSSIGSSPYVVKVVPGPSHGPSCTLLAFSEWNDTSPAFSTLTMRDRFGNLRSEPNGAVTNMTFDNVMVTVSSTVQTAYGPVSYVETGASMYSGNGTYSLTFPCRSIVCNASVTVRGADVSGSPFVYTRVAGPLMGNTSNAWGPGLYVSISGEPTWIKLQTRDEHGNPRVFPAPSLELAAHSTVAESVIVSPSSLAPLGVQTPHTTTVNSVQAWAVRIGLVSTDAVEFTLGTCSGAPFAVPCTNTAPYNFTQTTVFSPTGEQVDPFSTLPSVGTFNLFSSMLSASAGGPTPAYSPAGLGAFQSGGTNFPIVNDTPRVDITMEDADWLLDTTTQSISPCGSRSNCQLLSALWATTSWGAFKFPSPSTPNLGSSLWPVDISDSTKVTDSSGLFINPASLAANCSGNNSVWDMYACLSFAAVAGLPTMILNVSTVNVQDGTLTLEHVANDAGIWMVFINVDGVPIINSPSFAIVLPGSLAPTVSDTMLSTFAEASRPVAPSSEAGPSRLLPQTYPLTALEGLFQPVAQSTLQQYSTGSQGSGTPIVDTPIDIAEISPGGVAGAFSAGVAQPIRFSPYYPRSAMFFDSFHGVSFAQSTAGAAVSLDIVTRDALGNRLFRQATESQQLVANWISPNGSSSLLQLFPGCFTPGTYTSLFLPTSVGRHIIEISSRTNLQGVLTRYYTTPDFIQSDLLASRITNSFGIVVQYLEPDQSSMDGVLNDTSGVFLSSQACSVRQVALFHPYFSADASALAREAAGMPEVNFTSAASGAVDPSSAVCSGPTETFSFVLERFDSSSRITDRVLGTPSRVTLRITGGMAVPPAGTTSLQPETGLTWNTLFDSSTVVVSREVWIVDALLQSGCFYGIMLQFSDDFGNLTSQTGSSKPFDVGTIPPRNSTNEQRGVSLKIASQTFNTEEAGQTSKCAPSTTTSVVQEAISVPLAFVSILQEEAVGSSPLYVDVRPAPPSAQTSIYSLSSDMEVPIPSSFASAALSSVVNPIAPRTEDVQIVVQIMDSFGNIAQDFYAGSLTQPSPDDAVQQFQAQWPTLMQAGVVAWVTRDAYNASYLPSGVNPGSFLILSSETMVVGPSSVFVDQPPFNGSFTLRFRPPFAGTFRVYVALLPSPAVLIQLYAAEQWLQQALTLSANWQDFSSFQQYNSGLSPVLLALADCGCSINVKDATALSSNVEAARFVALPAYSSSIQGQVNAAAVRSTVFDISELWANPSISVPLPLQRCSPLVVGYAAFPSFGLSKAVAGVDGVFFFHIVDEDGPLVSGACANSLIESVNSLQSVMQASAPMALPCVATTTLAPCDLNFDINYEGALQIVNASFQPFQVEESFLLSPDFLDLFGNSYIGVHYLIAKAGMATVQIGLQGQLVVDPQVIEVTANVADPSQSTLAWDVSSNAAGENDIAIRLALTQLGEAFQLDRSWGTSGIVASSLLRVRPNTVTLVTASEVITASPLPTSCSSSTTCLPGCLPYAMPVMPSVISRLAYWNVPPNDLIGVSLAVNSSAAAVSLHQRLQQIPTFNKLNYSQALASEYAQSGTVWPPCDPCVELTVNTGSCAVIATDGMSNPALTLAAASDDSASMPTLTLSLLDAYGNQRISTGGTVAYSVFGGVQANISIVTPLQYGEMVPISGTWQLIDPTIWGGIPGAAPSLFDPVNCQKDSLTASCFWQLGDMGSGQGGSPQMIHTGVVGMPNAVAGRVFRIFSVENADGTLGLPLPSISPMLVYFNQSNASDLSACALQTALKRSSISPAGLTLIIDANASTPFLVPHSTNPYPFDPTSAIHNKLVEISRATPSSTGEFSVSCNDQAASVVSLSSGPGACPALPTGGQTAIVADLRSVQAGQDLGFIHEVSTFLPASTVGTGLTAWLMPAWKLILGDVPDNKDPVLFSIDDTIDFENLWSIPRQLQSGTVLVGAATAATWTGYMLAPVDATYTFVLGCDQPCELQLDGISVASYAPHLRAEDAALVGDPGVNITGVIVLRGPQLYRIVFSTLKMQNPGSVHLSWKWDAGVFAPKLNEQPTIPGSSCMWIAQTNEPTDCVYERMYLRQSALQYRSQTELQIVPKEALFPDYLLQALSGSPHPALVEL